MARYAITDIHGCLRTFKALVTAQLQLKKSDELYLLGDYVNKGPDSKGVIDFILHLQKQDYQVICLRGNHDQMLLSAVEKGDKVLKLTPAEKKMTLASFGVNTFSHLSNKYTSFLDGLLFYLELPDCFLVHAGFDFNQSDIFKDKDAMLNIRQYKTDWARLNNKRLIHGHTPVALHSIKLAATTKVKQVNLDAGCVYYRNASYGNLVALDLDSYQIYVQPNLDKPYKVGVKK